MRADDHPKLPDSLADDERLLAGKRKHGDLDSFWVEDAVSELERRIKKSYPEVQRVFIEVQAKHDGMARRTS